MHIKHWVVPIKTAHSIPDTYITQGKWLRVRIVHVGDGDGARAVHLPPLRYWLSKGHKLSTSNTVEDKPFQSLAKETISIRLAGVDAPEGGHFGRDAQPWAKEARSWLEGYILGHVCIVKCCKRDQYGRLVGMVWVWKPLVWWLPFIKIKRNVSLELVKSGLAVVYESKTGQFDGIKDKLLSAQNKARKWRMGIWSNGSSIETPGDFKKKNNVS